MTAGTRMAGKGVTMRRLNLCLLPTAYCLLLLTGCDTRDADMYYQPKKQPYQASEFFENGMSARPLVAGTVARSRDGLERSGMLYYKNAQPGHVEPSPDSVSAADTGFPADFPTSGADLQMKLARGQERFNIYCS